MRHAGKLGATDAAAEASEGCGLSVSVRKGELENVERNRDKSLSVSVYVGQRRGNASTSDFSDAAIEQTVQAAYDIARFTAEDPMAGLPDAADIAPAVEPGGRTRAVLPVVGDQRAGRRTGDALRAGGAWRPTSASPTAKAPPCRRSNRISSAPIPMGFAAATRVRAIRSRSRRSPPSATTCSVTPGTARCATRPSWPAATGVGRYAAERALSRLGARKISTRQCPVLFESPLAAGLLGAFVQAISGGALYRKSSFLLDSLGKQVLAKHIDIVEDPFIKRGKGSSPFDDEGVRVCAAHGGRGGPGQGLFPEQLHRAQAGHAHHRQRRRIAQPGAAFAAHRARRRSRRDAAQARARPVRDRADGPGRQLRDGRLLARCQRLLGRERPHRRTRCTRSRSPAT